jgi:site-specific recombinase XerD
MNEAWQRCYAAFLSQIENISGSTRSRDTYRYVLNLFFKDGRNPDEISRSDVQNFLDAPSHLKYQQGQSVKPGTRNSRLVALSSFYKFAASYEVNGEPILQVKPPVYGMKYLKINNNPHALSSQEIEKFFSAIDTTTIKGKRDIAIFLTYFLTAKRRSEVSNLKVGDIQEAALIDNDGQVHQGHVFQYHAKGRSRIITTSELPSLAYESIIRYWRESGRLNTLTPESPVFASTRPDQPEQQLTGDYMNALCKHYMALAKLNPGYSLHSFRHSSARHRYELGSDIRAIQETLGHTSLSTTSHYLKSLTVTHDTGADLLTKRFGHLGKL